MPDFRVDVHSEPGFGGDKLKEIREAVAGSTLRSPTARYDDEYGEIIVEFDVEAGNKGNAIEIGERELRRVLDAAGIDMSFGTTGSTGWGG
jgi:hypothetical protein